VDTVDAGGLAPVGTVAFVEIVADGLVPVGTVAFVELTGFLDSSIVLLEAIELAVLTTGFVAVVGVATVVVPGFVVGLTLAVDVVVAALAAFGATTLLVVVGEVVVLLERAAFGLGKEGLVGTCLLAIEGLPAACFDPFAGFTAVVNPVEPMETLLIVC